MRVFEKKTVMRERKGPTEETKIEKSPAIHSTGADYVIKVIKKGGKSRKA